MRRLVVLLATVLLPASLPAQQVTIGVTEFNVNDGYWEYIGGRWSYFGPGFGFGFGGLDGPALGGFDPNAGLNTGLFVGGSGTGLGFNLNAGTGRSTVVTSTTPMLTVTNGVPGSIFVGRQVPFVTGVVPINGLNPALNPAFTNLGPPNTLADRLPRGGIDLNQHLDPAAVDPREQPHAGGPVPPAKVAAPPIEAVEKPAAAASVDPAADLWAKAQQLERDGKPGAAKLLYQTARRTATGDLKSQIEARLQALSPQPSEPRP